MVRTIFTIFGDAAHKLGRAANAYRKNVVKSHATARSAGRDSRGRPRTAAQAVYQKVMRRSPSTESKMTNAQKAKKLIDKYGGKAAAGRATGMTRHAIGRAAKGMNLNAENSKKLDAGERKLAMSKRTADRFARSMNGIPRDAKPSPEKEHTLGFWCRIVVSSKSEDRWIFPGGVPENEGKLDDIQDIIEQDGFSGLNDRMHEILDEYFPGDLDYHVDEVMDIQY